MYGRFKKSLSILIFVFLFTSFAFVSALTVSECKMQLKEISQELLDKNVYNPRLAAFVKENVILTEEELIEFCDQLLLYRKDLGSKSSDVESIKNELISYLRSFVASGMDVGEVDPNFAFGYNVQNPDFTVTFKNPAGEVKTRKYVLRVKSVGFKFELVIKINGIMILGEGFNYYDSANKEYELGSGFDMAYYPHKGLDGAFVNRILALSGIGHDDPRYAEANAKLRGLSSIGSGNLGLCLTFAKIKETGCMLVIVGLAFGFGEGGIMISRVGNFWVFSSIPVEGALVFGGKMTPIAK